MTIFVDPLRIGVRWTAEPFTDCKLRRARYGFAQQCFGYALIPKPSQHFVKLRRFVFLHVFAQPAYWPSSPLRPPPAGARERA